MSLAHIPEPLGRSLIRLDEVAAARSRKSVIETLGDAGGWEAPEEGTERCRMLEAALAARGTPFRIEGGQIVFGGWSLVRAAAVFATERDLIQVQQVDLGVTNQEARLALTQWGMAEIKTRHAEPGDVLLFAMPDEPVGRGRVVAGGVHAAVLSGAGGELSWAMLPGRSNAEARILHAPYGRAVCESWAGPYWTSKLIGAWSFDTGRKTRPYRLEAA